MFLKGTFSQSDEIQENKPSTNEIENLLKFGAFAFLDEGKEGEDLKTQKIEDILKKNSILPDKRGNYKLTKSTFDVEEDKIPNVHDKEFWSKMMPQLETVSISAMEKNMRMGKSEIV